jgi:hypothetical protein
MTVGRLGISPNGAYLTSAYDTIEGESVIVVDLHTARQTAFLSGGKLFNWHPNGHEFLFAAQEVVDDQGLWLVEASSGEHRLLAPVTLHGAATSPDGQVLAYSNGGIWMANADGSVPQQVVDSAATIFAWSPDNRYLLYGVYPHEGDKSDTPPSLPHLWLMDRYGRNQRSINLTWEPGITVAAHQQPAWSPTSQYVAHSSSLDPDFSYWGDKEAPRDDPLYAFRNAGVYVEDVETGELWLAAENALDPTWSPDGSMLAIAKMDENDQVDI